MKKEFQRIAVVGTCCSGKTTFAKTIAEILGIPHIELDSFYWKPNWQLSDNEEFRTATKRIVSGEYWVIDGNGSSVRDLIWGKATTVIWLNYPFYIVLLRAIRRTLKRLLLRKRLSSGNYETLRHVFFSKHSAVYYAIKTFKLRRDEFSRQFRYSKNEDLYKIELKYPKEAKEFITHMSKFETIQPLKEKRGFHIGFCGIDGAGKTTQAMLLFKCLKEKGGNVVFYEEKRNFVSEITNTIARRNNFPTGRKYLGEPLYMTCMSFEVLRQNMLNIQPHIKLGINIISSRTVFDWLAGTKAKKCPSSQFNLIKEIMLFAGIPDLILWLDTSPKIALERIIKRQIDSADIDFLIEYRSAFQNLLEDYSHHRIIGDGDIQSVREDINLIVKNFLDID